MTDHNEIFISITSTFIINLSGFGVCNKTLLAIARWELWYRESKKTLSDQFVYIQQLTADSQNVTWDWILKNARLNHYDFDQPSATLPNILTLIPVRLFRHTEAFICVVMSSRLFFY